MKIINKVRREIINIMNPELGRILMLHRVTDNRSRIKANRNLEVTPSYLEYTILKYKRNGYSFVSINEVCERLKYGIRDGKFVALTFDDGYKDNYTKAYPVLKKHDIPFTIYITTDFYEKKTMLWWYVLEKLGVTDDEFEKYREKIFNIPPNDIRSEIERCFRGHGVNFDEVVDELTISKDELLYMSTNKLCTIGCHTMTHTRLDCISMADQERELRESKQKLESLINRPILHFSYPYGFYNAGTVSLLQSLGYESSVKTHGGVIRKNTNIFELNRIELRQE